MIRKAKLSDAVNMQKLINHFAGLDLMLPRSLNEIYENLRDFWIYIDGAEVRGCCALHITGWDRLAEIESLAVTEDFQGKGIAKDLVLKCVDEAKGFGIDKIFVLTYQPDYFKNIGFGEINKDKLPRKIWAECCNCPKFPGCSEIALVKKIQPII